MVFGFQNVAWHFSCPKELKKTCFVVITESADGLAPLLNEDQGLCSAISMLKADEFPSVLSWKEIKISIDFSMKIDWFSKV